jgi:hypothetical protein
MPRIDQRQLASTRLYLSVVTEPTAFSVRPKLTAFVPAGTSGDVQVAAVYVAAAARFGLWVQYDQVPAASCRYNVKNVGTFAL